MPILLRCPSCRSVFAFPEQLAGQPARCQKCQIAFRVPQQSVQADEPALQPSRLPRIPHAKQKRGFASGKLLVAFLALVIAIGMLGGAAVLIGIAVIRKPESANPVAERVEMPPQPPAENPPQVAKAPAKEEGFPLDPFPAPFALPDRRDSIPLPNPGKLVFPTPASPFVAIVQNANDQGSVYTVWDLRNGRQLGTVTLHGEQYGSFTLSPDGLYLAAYLREDSHNTLEVWSVANGRSVRRIDLRQPGYPVLIHWLFAGPGLLLTTQSGHTDDLLRIWDVATGKCLRQFPAPVGAVGVKAFALSPGGRYLAAAHRKSDRLVICDLTAGKVVDEWRIPVPNALMYLLSWAFAFSQDGRSLYLLYFCGLDFYLANYDLSTGQARTQRLEGWGDLSNPLLTADFETGPLLQSLSDGKLMLAGYLLVDPKAGRVVRKLPAPTFQGDNRRVIGAKWAVITGPPGGRQLIVQPCPPP